MYYRFYTIDVNNLSFITEHVNGQCLWAHANFIKWPYMYT